MPACFMLESVCVKRRGNNENARLNEACASKLEPHVLSQGGESVPTGRKPKQRVHQNLKQAFTRTNPKWQSAQKPHNVHCLGLESIIQVKLNLNGRVKLSVKR
jgi:hypothetical protein